MAPQPSIPLPATILGTLGTVFWCIQLIPQVYRNHRTKSTEGLPASMMFLWSSCGVPFGVYAVLQAWNIPIQVQPPCFTLLCLASWGQCMRYGRKWRRMTATCVTIAIGFLFAGLEVMLILLLRPIYAQGIEWPVTLFGIIAAVLLISGYIPVPFEIIKRRGRVIGIDFIFLTIDSLGAFFSLLSIAVQKIFDPLGGVMYSMCLAIELGIFLSHGIWLWRTREIRRRMSEENKTWEEHEEAQEWEQRRWKWDTWFQKKEARIVSGCKDENRACEAG